MSVPQGPTEWDDGRIQMGFRGEKAAPSKTSLRPDDEKIREEVLGALARDPRVDASEVEVSVVSGTVTLGGTVIERRMKYAAEDCVDGIRGVNHVKNEIRVQAQPNPRSDNL